MNIAWRGPDGAVAVRRALSSFVDSSVISHTLPSHHYTLIPIFCQFLPLDSPKVWHNWAITIMGIVDPQLFSQLWFSRFLLGFPVHWHAVQVLITCGPHGTLSSLPLSLFILHMQVAMHLEQQLPYCMTHHRSSFHHILSQCPTPILPASAYFNKFVVLASYACTLSTLSILFVLRHSQFSSLVLRLCMSVCFIS